MAKTTPAVHSILFGNPVVQEAHSRAGAVVGADERPDLGKQTTLVELPDEDAAGLIAGIDQFDAAVASMGREQLMLRLIPMGEPLELWEVPFAHIVRFSRTHAAAGFDWAHCPDHIGLEAALAKVFDATRGRQDGYGEVDLPPLAGGSEETDLAEVLAEMEARRWPGIEAGLRGKLTMLKTTVGFEGFAKALFGASTQPAQFCYMAITSNAHVPVAADSTLTSENVTGGLKRRLITYGYTSETHKATSAATFTAEAANVGELPYTVKVFGLFNKVTSGGEMGIETELGVSAKLEAEGDNVTITDTIELK